MIQVVMKKDADHELVVATFLFPHDAREWCDTANENESSSVEYYIPEK